MLKFTIHMLLLVAVSIVGIVAPESIAMVQGSDVARWAVALSGGIILAYVLVWLATAAPDAEDSRAQGEQLSWQRVKLKGRGQYVRGLMIADLKRVLFFHPFLVLLIGWILGWDVNKIVGVVSAINFLSICGSLFRALRQWELKGKESEISLSTDAA